LVTGGNSGIGFEIVRILYAKDATVYIAARNPALIDEAIKQIRETHPSSKGQLKSVIIDLNDLTTISPGISKFLNQESRLDVLFLNGGLAQIPPGTVSAQGHEIHMAVNCLGSFAVHKMLLPLVLQTAKESSEASVRVLWTSSGIIDLAKVPGGLSLAQLVPGQHGMERNANYSSSKAGNWLLASELDRRVRKENVLSVAFHPGTLNTKGLTRAPLWMQWMLKPFSYKPVYGAYTSLWAGLSQEVKLEDGGRFGIPFGRWHPNPRQDCLESMKRVEEGGTGLAAAFWDWCEEQTAPFLAEESAR
jgi:NAD(P)-dependent dehydrogenase (short-subunit alcohol dehydrogenase family)